MPLYFFTGGAAGAAAIIATAAQMTGAPSRLIRDARYLAAIGGTASPALLIADLGMPSRFLNMLRVFKIQSPMSVGSWTLFVFSSSAAAAFLSTAGRSDRARPVRAVASTSNFLSLISGASLASYTGVLIGATAIPVWSANARMLPLHFAASGMGTAAAMLELRNHRIPALNAIGIAAAATETVVGASIELRNPTLNPLKQGRSGGNPRWRISLRTASVGAASFGAHIEPSRDLHPFKENRQRLYRCWLRFNSICMDVCRARICHPTSALNAA